MFFIIWTIDNCLDLTLFNRISSTVRKVRSTKVNSSKPIVRKKEIYCDLIMGVVACFDNNMSQKRLSILVFFYCYNMRLKFDNFYQIPMEITFVWYIFRYQRHSHVHVNAREFEYHKSVTKCGKNTFWNDTSITWLIRHFNWTSKLTKISIIITTYIVWQHTPIKIDKLIKAHHNIDISQNDVMTCYIELRTAERQKIICLPNVELLDCIQQVCPATYHQRHCRFFSLYTIQDTST